MDRLQHHDGLGRARSPSAASPAAFHQHQHQHQEQQQPHIRSHSQSPAPQSFSSPQDTGLGLGIVDHSQTFSGFSPNPSDFLNPRQSQGFPSQGQLDPSSFDATQTSLPFDGNSQAQSAYSHDFINTSSNSNFGGSDFSLFPPATAEQLSTPLFVSSDSQPQPPQLSTPDLNMSTSQVHHSPTPPHHLNPEPHQPGSAHQSPSFNQHQFSSPPGRHSRHASLGPEAALLQGQADWSGTQFQGHRRTPSEYSDVSSVAPSPNLVSHDSFDHIEHSPLQRPVDAAGLYQELHGLGNFSLADPQPSHSPDLRGRSPSLSPAISPRILPQPLPDMNQTGNSFVLQGPNNGFGTPHIAIQASEAFPQLPPHGMMTAPTINIDYAPTNMRNFEGRPMMDSDALIPPDRGRMRNRPRAVTDPYAGGSSAPLQRPLGSASLSPSPGMSSRDSSRSLSPLDDRSVPPNKRRQSTSSVPNNVMALRLADPEFAAQAGADGTAAGGGPKRVQKHPATFQCSLCPKRFTRAYNLRSHLRTHTDERPFVCTVCGKAFARQHDRKRHEGLHSGEKKFVCKGDLKTSGQWGCGRRFARADALGRHFRSEAGRICIKPLLDEEMMERQRIWQEQRMHATQHQQHNMVMAPPGIDPNTGYPVDAAGNYALPAALLAQYPALAQLNWGSGGMDGSGSGIEDEISGRSSFDASDYDDADDGGYVSGPGTGYGQGGMTEGFGEMGYASDYGGR